MHFPSLKIGALALVLATLAGCTKKDTTREQLAAHKAFERLQDTTTTVAQANQLVSIIDTARKNIAAINPTFDLEIDTAKVASLRGDAYMRRAEYNARMMREFIIPSEAYVQFAKEMSDDAATAGRNPPLNINQVRNLIAEAKGREMVEASGGAKVPVSKAELNRLHRVDAAARKARTAARMKSAKASRKHGKAPSKRRVASTR